MELGEFQTILADTYLAKDLERGTAATIAWLAEETGELAKAIRKGTRDEQIHELGDVLAWVVSLANQLDIEIEEVAKRYFDGCPSCEGVPCVC
tara:strand:- start:1861 stop:2139 length:279 start_codon:yes stop_codon:yes gene_type:complete